MGLLCFPSLSSANPEPDNHQAILPASGMSEELADFTHSEVRRGGGVGSHDLVFCLLRLQMVNHLFLFAFRPPLQCATCLLQATKSTDAWKRRRIPLVLGLRQLQVLHVVAFLCFCSLHVSVAAAIETEINAPSILSRISSPGKPSVRRVRPSSAVRAPNAPV